MNIRAFSLCLTIVLSLVCASMIAAAVDQEKDALQQWRELNGRTTDFYKNQKFMKAAGSGRAAVETARGLSAEHRDKLAISLGNLSMIYTHLGKFAEAEEAAKEELRLRQELYGQQDPQVATAWNHLAIIYTLAGKLKRVNPDAEQCLLQIVAIEEKARGKESPDIIPALEKLEKYYRITGNTEKEKEVARRIAALRPQKKTAP